MSKITVRADDELVSRLEAMDASKSQIVREALRAYLTDAGELRGVEGVLGGAFIEDADGGSIGASSGSLDAIVAERVDDRMAEQLPALVDECVRDALADAGALGRDVNVNITLDGADVDADVDADSSIDEAESPPSMFERTGEDSDETSNEGDDSSAPEAQSAVESIRTETTESEGDAGTGQEQPTASDGSGDADGVVEGAAVDAPADGDEGGGERAAPDEDASTCAQCGSQVSAEHVHCPNCGAKTSRRVFCECGDEVRSDWSFCPSCGRRTAAAGVLDSS